MYETLNPINSFIQTNIFHVTLTDKLSIQSFKAIKLSEEMVKSTA